MPLDIHCFRDEVLLQKVKQSQMARSASVEQVDLVCQLDRDWRETDKKVNLGNKQLNILQKELAPYYKSKQPPPDSLKLQIADLREELIKLSEKTVELLKQRNLALNKIGNLIDLSVPISKSETDNKVCIRWGQPGKAQYHHHELLWMIGGYDPQKGSEVAGHRGYYLKGPAVLLNQALINYGLSFLMKKQYEPVQPPYFMKKEIMGETAQLEDFEESLYQIQDGSGQDYCLIATSEQPLTALHRGQRLQASGMPMRYVGTSTCFRKEAGAHGKDTWGLFRIHQFEKIEQFCITTPEQSPAMLDQMLANSCEFYQSLRLPYQVVEIVSGALNLAAAKKYDLEVWFPAQMAYKELVSASNCTDYQSRALDVKVNNKDQDCVHMLNGTLCATERTLCCILENYQSPVGICVPPVLRPFMGGLEMIPYVNEPPKASATADALRAK